LADVFKENHRSSLRLCWLRGYVFRAIHVSEIGMAAIFSGTARRYTFGSMILTKTRNL
jgi:hypothetical protein